MPSDGHPASCSRSRSRASTSGSTSSAAALSRWSPGCRPTWSATDEAPSALVELQQRQRDRHAYMAQAPITVNEVVLASTGWALDDVPAVGAVVLLAGPANVGVGGEPVDVTELVHPDLLSLAVDASWAIPGLRNTGVDLIAPDLDTIEGAVVIETNFLPDIRVHHHPAYGRPRDVAGAIVDEMIAASGLTAWKRRLAGVPRRVARAARKRLRT